MKFEFNGIMCFVSEIGAKQEKVNIVVPRLAKDGKDFIMNLSGPEDAVQWVTIFVRKKKNDEWKVVPIDIVCDSHEQVINFVDSLQLKYTELGIQAQIEKKKPWLKVRRLQQQERGQS